MTGQAPTTVAILGGGAVVGRALALLLRGAGYDAEFVEAHPTGPAQETLDGVDVVLLFRAPGTSAGPWESFLGLARSAPETARTSVLTLTTSPAEALANVRASAGSVVVAWPCRIEALAREIEAALASARSGNEQGELSLCGCGRPGC